MAWVTRCMGAPGCLTIAKVMLSPRLGVWFPGLLAWSLLHACVVQLDDPFGRACDQEHPCARGICSEGACTPIDEVGLDAATSVSFAANVQPLFDASCVSCHSGATPAAGLVLSTGRAHASLVNVDSEECGSGAVRVRPGDVEDSVLWEALSGRSDCVQSMPPGGPPYSVLAPGAFRIIERWIRDGARDD